MKIKHKLFISYSFLTLLVLLIGIISFFLNKRLIKIVQVEDARFHSIVSPAIMAFSITNEAKVIEKNLILYVALNDEKYRGTFLTSLNNLKTYIASMKKQSFKTKGRLIAKKMEETSKFLNLKGEKILEIYDAPTEPFDLEKNRLILKEFHDLASKLRKLGIEYTSIITSPLNKQIIIYTSTEIGSFAKRACGHLIQYLLFNDKLDRDKFFLRIESLEEQINVLSKHIMHSEGIHIIDSMLTNKDFLVLQGKRILDDYDKMLSENKPFLISENRKTILEIYDSADDLQGLCETLIKHKLEYESSNTKQHQRIVVFSNLISSVSIIVAIIFSISIAIISSRTLLAPLIKLQRALKQFGEGDLNTKVNIRSNDEIMAIAHSFNDMADNIGTLTNELHAKNMDLSTEIEERKIAQEKLENALDEIQALRGILPICSFCKKIRDDMGSWEQMETYISNHSEVDFSHGLCPDCAKKEYKKYNLKPRE